MNHRFEPIAKEPAYLKVFRTIEADILAGRLEPGASLPTEGELSNQFGLNRSTVREGIRQLEEAGLVERGAAKRLIVCRPEAGSVAQRASRSLAHQGVTFIDVWETLVLVEPEAARLAASRCTEEQIEACEAAHAAFDTLDADDHEKLVELAVGFFQRVAECTDNDVLLVTLQSLNMLIAPPLRLVLGRAPRATRRIRDAQAMIIEALRKGDGDKAAEWMLKHVNDLKRGFSVAGLDLNDKVL
ncbi:MAG: FCD domain-containing protein [Pseudomonadota bacterium]